MSSGAKKTMSTLSDPMFFVLGLLSYQKLVHVLLLALHGSSKKY
jgi:hypothetical protein